MGSSKEYQRQRYAHALQHRLCTDCYAVLPEDARRRTCDVCTQKRRPRSAKKRRRVVQGWRELKRCVDCGMERVPGSVRCGYHLERNQEVKQARVDRGQCLDCVSPHEPGRARCQRCLDRIASGNRERRKCPKLSNPSR